MMYRRTDRPKALDRSIRDPIIRSQNPSCLAGAAEPVLTLLSFSNCCYTIIVTDTGEKQRGWFVLVYKLPAEPSRLRASVWRKLKAAGAVYLQNGVAALSADAAGERAMRGAAQEVRELGGTAHLLRGEVVGDEPVMNLDVFTPKRPEYA